MTRFWKANHNVTFDIILYLCLFKTALSVRLYSLSCVKSQHNFSNYVLVHIITYTLHYIASHIDIPY